jgi:general secretion pathway protein K
MYRAEVGPTMSGGCEYAGLEATCADDDAADDARMSPRGRSIGDEAGAPKPGERGFILVAVLWILAALATLASIYAVYVDVSGFAFRVDDDRLRIRASIESGLELAAFELAAAREDARPPRGAFSLRLDRSAIDVTFTAEGARIDLNAASKETLAGLFAAVGASPDDAAAFADRLVGWRTKADAAGQNDELALYKSAGYAYSPRQAPFRNVLELSLVLGIPPGIVERVLPFVTIFSGQGEIDVRVADYTVLSALPKATPEQINQVIALRAQGAQDGEGLLKLLGPASAGATTKTSAATRVRAAVRLDDGRKARVEVVILMLKGEDRPFRVLSWRDDVGGSF